VRKYVASGQGFAGRKTGRDFWKQGNRDSLSAIESETGAATAVPTVAEAPQSRPPESGGSETNSRPAGKRRASPYTRPSAASWSNWGRTGASPTRLAAAPGSGFYPEGTRARKTWCPLMGEKEPDLRTSPARWTVSRGSWRRSAGRWDDRRGDRH